MRDKHQRCRAAKIIKRAWILEPGLGTEGRPSWVTVSMSHECIHKGKDALRREFRVCKEPLQSATCLVTHSAVLEG